MSAARATRPGAREGAEAVTGDSEEVARFEALAGEWWDPNGPFRPLHRLNPVRLGYIRDRLAGHFGRDPRGRRPLDGLAVLDVGCGGGILCEPLVRLGARVTGIDAAEGNVTVAALHARRSGLAVDYRAAMPEVLARSGETFDAVISLEVVEHVAERDAFLAALAALTAPGGALVMSTLNRTLKSLLLAKIGAEYVLRWLPVGTHDWRKFVSPSELGAALAAQGFEVRDVTGVAYAPFSDTWRLGRDADVNYMLYAARSPA